MRRGVPGGISRGISRAGALSTCGIPAPAEQVGFLYSGSEDKAASPRKEQVPFLFLLFSQLFSRLRRGLLSCRRGRSEGGRLRREAPRVPRPPPGTRCPRPRRPRGTQAPAAGSAGRARGPGSQRGYLGVARARARLGRLVRSPGSSRLGPAGGGGGGGAPGGARSRTQSPEWPPRAGPRAPALGPGLSGDAALEVPIWQGCARPRARGFWAVSPGQPRASAGVGGHGPLRWGDFKAPGGASGPAHTPPAQDTLGPTQTSFAWVRPTGHWDQHGFSRSDLCVRKAWRSAFPKATKWGRWAVWMPEGGRRSPPTGMSVQEKAGMTSANLQSTISDFSEVCRFLKKLNIERLYDPAGPLPKNTECRD